MTTRSQMHADLTDLRKRVGSIAVELDRMIARLANGTTPPPRPEATDVTPAGVPPLSDHEREAARTTMNRILGERDR